MKPRNVCPLQQRRESAMGPNRSRSSSHSSTQFDMRVTSWSTWCGWSCGCCESMSRMTVVSNDVQSQRVVRIGVFAVVSFVMIVGEWSVG